jgi:ribosomal protein L40E
LEQCSLCGTNNPSEARFCLKCGYDLQQDAADDSTDDSDPDTFTPAASGADARLARREAKRRKEALEPGEVEAYKEHAAAQSKAAFESQVHHNDVDEPSEIDLGAVTADFATRRRFCDRCGAANPYEQRFCLQCGNTLGQEAPAEADSGVNAAPVIPLAPLSAEPFEHAALADLHSAPASDYFSEQEQKGGRPYRSRQIGSSLAQRGPGLWLLIGATLLVAAALVWLIGLGGFDLLFNAKVRGINKAARTMERLPSFQYNVSAAVRTADDVQYPGGGKAMYESPHKSSWSVALNTPGKPIAAETVEVDDKVYQNGMLLQPSRSQSPSGDVTDLWRDFRSVEDLGMQPIGAVNCRHYRYRVPPNLITTVLGVGKQDAASDAVVESWVDTGSSQVVRMTAQVFNVQIEGASTTVQLAMDLVAVGQPYNISAPAQQSAPAPAP